MRNQFKRIAYVSTISVSRSDAAFSVEMMKILNQARTYNRQKNITGVLLLSGSTIVQFLEGTAADVGKLMYKIMRDSRHTDVSLFVNQNVQERLFESWSMRLVTESTALREQVIEQIDNAHARDLAAVSLADKHRLAHIFKHNKFSGNGQIDAAVTNGHTTSKTVAAKPKYETSKMKLRVWPRPNQIRLTKDVLSLCSNLAAKPKSLDELRSAAIVRDETTLISGIQGLDGLGLLSYQSLSSVGSVTSSSVNAGSSRFSRVLRRFIDNNRQA